MDADIKSLSDTLIGEIFFALGLSKTRFRRPDFWLAFPQSLRQVVHHRCYRRPYDRQRRIPGRSRVDDEPLGKQGNVRGAETIPSEGPLLIIANHCGAYDFLVIPSQLCRADIRIISSDIPFLKHLPNASKHLFFLTDATQDRMMAARGALRYLQSSGSLLLFGTGLIDPDPAVYAGAGKSIEDWSPSIDLFLRQAPETQVVVAICSGIVSSRWAHHPMTHLRRIDWQKRRLAEFGQVLQQLFLPGKLYVTPRVSFAPPVSLEELRRERGEERVLPAVIAAGKALLVEHMQWSAEAQKLLMGFYQKSYRISHSGDFAKHPVRIVALIRSCNDERHYCRAIL